MLQINEIINEPKLLALLNDTARPETEKVLGILNKALQKKGLELEEIASLIKTEDSVLLEKMFEVANKIKDDIYGERLVLFAPLYISSFCVNDCQYCGFHCSNATARKKLTLLEVEEQVKFLIDMGHKRLLLEFGEDPHESSIDYVVDVIKTIYKTKSGNGEIRRVNLNIAATSVEDYKKLKEVGIGTYQLFQETYHRDTYAQMHVGPKADYERQLLAHDRAFEAGIDDVGIGVLFGLYDWRFEVLALVSHAQYLDKKFGVGPHTISVPRWQPAESVDWQQAPHLVSEEELLKVIAILRMAVPYTGMIISTRERPEVRAKAFKLGISQTSAASRTSPGGYGTEHKLEQFVLADHRTLDESIESILEQNLLPSFCTACYRLGRTGSDFMTFAKPGDIQDYCRPNAILTFKEYLEDYASPKVKELGVKVLNSYLNKITNQQKVTEVNERLLRIEQGERDLYF
ncbi:MAG: Strongly similair to thiamine biosynthesis enzyme ThiH [Parcubacteria group bacterium GW2011_GWC2_38_7]|nr:MAG: Strongly similair to thiamine biosynthesis enzyme ThiH [Parcubacteria group bacterium GW2011_GWC2_38_7]